MIAVPAPPVLVGAAAVLVGAGAEVWQSDCYNHSNGDDFQFGLVDMSIEEYTFDIAKHRQWVLVKAETQMRCEEVADKLFKYKVVGGVARLGDRIMMLMKKPRGSVGCLTMLPDATYWGFVVPPSVSASSKAAGVKVFQDFLRTGREVVANYIIVNTGIEEAPDVVAEKNREVTQFWKERSKAMTFDQFEDCYCEAKLVKAANRTLEQICLVLNMPSFRLIRKKHEEGKMAHLHMCCNAFDARLDGIIFKEMPAFMALEVWGVDFDTMCVFRMSLGEFARQGLWAKFCVVLFGGPRMGKTPCAESFAAGLAKSLQLPSVFGVEEMEACYFLKTGSVEDLKKVKEHLRPGVPLLFDDVTPAY